MKTLARILYVEDEGDIREIAELALSAVGGFAVQACTSGLDALAKGPGFAPDLILLDVMMPGMDGPTTLSRLRSVPTLAQTPVVFITAKIQPQEVEELRALGALDVIAKPFDPMRLASDIQAIWDSHVD